jgi:hypothetical protein
VTYRFFDLLPLDTKKDKNFNIAKDLIMLRQCDSENQLQVASTLSTVFGMGLPRSLCPVSVIRM